MTVRVALVIVGDELLKGARADGNGPWLAARLRAEGAALVGLEIAGDAADEVARAVRRAAERADVVIVSGGLGPTDDDGTRAGIAAAAGVDLVEDAEALRQVRAAQAARGRDLDSRRRREALVPSGGRALPNPDGTAPGIEVRVGTALLFALPGVPREVRRMAEEAVWPRLRERGGLEAPAAEAFRVSGVREPDVADALADLAAEEAFDLGFYPHEGELEIRFTASGEGATPRVAAAAAEARRRLAPVYDDVPLERHVVETLCRQGLTVTTAESMTGGLVARMLTAVPGASDAFPGGWVVYSDAWKARLLGVDAALLREAGAVSEAVAVQMAEGARARARVDYALAVTGIAGPGDGADPQGNPIVAGTAFVAMARPGGPTVVIRHVAPHARETVQRRTAVAALDLLRRDLAGREATGEQSLCGAGPSG